MESSWNPSSYTPELDRPQHDRLVPCVITQQYSSATSVSLYFHSRSNKKLGVRLKTVTTKIIYSCLSRGYLYSTLTSSPFLPLYNTTSKTYLGLGVGNFSRGSRAAGGGTVCQHAAASVGWEELRTRTPSGVPTPLRRWYWPSGSTASLPEGTWL